MEFSGDSFEDKLDNLKNPSGQQRRDPRSVRRAAVTSAIVDSIDDVTPSKVYARAVTALEGTLTSKNMNIDAVGTQISILELLALTVPHVEPRTVLNATLPLTSRVLRGVVSTDGMETTLETKDELGGMNALLRWTCKATSAILGNLSSTSFDENEVKQLLRGTLLALFQDKRPKVRKAAHAAVIEMLASANRSPKLGVLTNNFVHVELKNGLLAVSKNDVESLRSMSHLLAFLERSIQYLNFAALFGDVMEMFALIMKEQEQQTSGSTSDYVMAARKVKDTSPQLLLISSILSLGLTLLSDESQKHKDKVDEIASRVLASLLQASPSIAFPTAEFNLLQNVKTQYGELIIAACGRLLSVTKLDIAVKLLPLAIQKILVLSLPGDDGDPDVAQTLMVALTQLIRTKFKLLMNQPECLTKMIQTMQTLMKNGAYQPTWSVSLKCYVVLASFLPDKVDLAVDSLVQLRGEASKSYQFAVEDAFSTLVQSVGMNVVWNSLHWNPKSTLGGVAEDRFWILSTMKNAAVAAQAVPQSLQFFQTEVLGLARACDKLAATRPPSETQFHRRCVTSLWALFPCFCRSPSDLEPEIEALAATLCRALGDKRYPELLTTICNGIVLAVKSFEENGGSELCESEQEAKALSSASHMLLPTLFKFVTDTHAAVSKERNAEMNAMDVEGDVVSGNAVEGFQKLKCVTEAISVLSRLAEHEFLEGLFKTVMQRLLEEFQSDFGDSERVCALLTLSQALVASRVLTEECLSLLYRALKPLIRNDESKPRVQKRAYKVLHELCERHSSFVTGDDRMKELIGLLTGTIMTSQISARFMRLKCMSLIVEGLDDTNQDKMSNINAVVPEVLLCLKDFNAKTRDAAYRLILTMADRNNLVDFVNIILAALGAKTPHMRSAVVLALSRLVFENAREDDELKNLLPRLLQTILVLINEGSREVLKSVVTFVRICVAAIPADSLEPLVPEIVTSLLSSEQVKSRFRAKVKIILKKLVKLFGYDTLLQHVPESESRLLTHMRKLDERERRKRESARGDMESRMGGFEEMVDSDEEDSDGGLTLATGATGLLSKKSRKSLSMDAKSTSTKISKMTRVSSMSRRGDDNGVRLPDEEQGEVVDLLGAKMAKRVHFAEEDSSGDDSDALDFDDDGKLVILDDEHMNTDAPEETEGMTLEGLKRKRASDRKRERHDKGDGSKKRKVGLGASYQSRKAGGDVKRKGQKYEPYAYVPLDGRAFSKKNRRHAVDQMSTVVRGKGSKKQR